MLGSAVFRTGVAPGGALAGPWVRNPLWTAARAVPSLDLRFADNKSLVDAATGQNLVTFTRASSGTYVDSQGVIRTATTNLLPRSEEFNDAVWGKVGGSLTADAIMAPNGQTTADLFTENTVLTQHDVRVTSPTLTDGVTYTLTVYSKTNGRRLNIIYPLDTAGHGATFDLINGTFTYTGNTVTATIQPVGDGWYRCSCTATKSGGSGTSQLRFLTHNGTTNNYTGDGTSGIYLWGAQLEQSSTVGEYIPTTSTINSAPRFDHNPTTGESLGLLVEESRTNLVSYSQDFSNAWWTISASTLPTINNTAPDGSSSAVNWVFDAASSASAVISSNLTKAASAITYTFSVFAKSNGYSLLRLYARDTSNSINRSEATFDLSIAATSSILSSGTFSGATPSITPLQNGWYRCVLTFTTGTETSINVRVNRNDALSPDGTSGIYVWGAQLEAGSFPTSYIPTTTAAATRSADVASIAGTNFSSWYRQDEGTVFVDATGVSNLSGATRRYVEIRDAGSSERLVLGYSALNNNRFLVVDTNITVADITVVSTQTAKAAGTYKFNSFQLASNGTLGTEDNVGTVPTPDQMQIGSQEGSTANTFLNGTIRRLCYWNQRLPNSTIQQITQ